jgi:uncharacterized membrane protein
LNIDFVVLRILHIVSGAFWVGTIVFMALILRPRLISLGVDRRVTQSIDRAVNAATGIAGLITVSAGIGLVLRLRWGHLDTFFNTGWGYAILIGFIAAMAAFAAGGMEGSASGRAASISNGQSGGDDAATLQALDARVVRLQRFHALFVLIAVGSMASARFV